MAEDWYMANGSSLQSRLPKLMKCLSSSAAFNMATVKVAVRVRPFNQREIDMQCQRIIDMESQKTKITNVKIPQSSQDGDMGRERIKEFSFDFSYSSFDPKEENYASQEQVFNDLGNDVIDNAFEGYNACIFAYGQTGSGKTYTMMGTPDSVGLIPRICQSLFERMKKDKAAGTTYRTEVSYLEIYNEKVKDLLKQGASQHSLKVREHPRLGPYVEELSKHLVMDYSDIHELMTRGNTNRTTAATNMNDVSSRSHAIFTITFLQAKFNKDMPSETASKVNLVDLAGSERADASGATGQRLKEGAHINKSLVTLGSVISALADMSSSKNKGRQIFIPYRDSVLTWLLKDSLGGNSKTIMIAAVSPADINYGETLSTLRYANRAKDIVNKPTINEDPNVKLIRELRAEIAKLRSIVGSNQESDNSPLVVEKLQANEARVKELTEEWTERWRETQKIFQELRTLALRKSGPGVILDSDRPHLVGIDDSVLSTGIALYNLKDGETLFGGEKESQNLDIVLDGPEIESEHCLIELKDGVAYLKPCKQALCYVDTMLVDKPTRLSHGCVILLGKSIMFRFNDPAEAARLRKEKEKGSCLNLSRLSFLSWSTPDLVKSVENLNSNVDVSVETKHETDLEKLEIKRQEIEKLKREFEEQRIAQQRAATEEMEQNRKQLEKLQQENKLLKKAAEMKKSNFNKNQNHFDAAMNVLEVEDHLVVDAERNIDIETTEKIQSKVGLKERETMQKEIETDLKRLIELECKQKQAVETNRNELKQEKENLIKEFTEQRKKIAWDLQWLEKREKELKKVIATKQLDLRHGKKGFASEVDDNIIQEHSKLCVNHIGSEESELNDELQKEGPLKTEKQLSSDQDGFKSRPSKDTSSDTCTEDNINDISLNKESKVGNELEKEETKITGTTSIMDSWEKELYNSSMKSLDAKTAIIQKQKVEIEALSKQQLELSSKILAEVDERRSQLEVKSEETMAIIQRRKNGLILELNTLIESKTHGDYSSASDATSSSDASSVHSDQFNIFCEENKINANKDKKQFKSALEKISGLRSSTHATSGSSIESELQKLKMDRISEFCTDMNKDEPKTEVSKLTELELLKEQYQRVEQDLEERQKQLEKEFQKLGIQPELEPEIEEEEKERINNLIKCEVQCHQLQQRLKEERQLKEDFEKSVDVQYRQLTDLNRLSPADFSMVGSYISQTSPKHATDHFSGITILIPSFIIRGAGSSAHYEYEVKVSIFGESWTIFRRYKRFRELHTQMKHKYGSKLNKLYFPPRKLFGSKSEKVVHERRKHLEKYLQDLVDLCLDLQEFPLSSYDGSLIKQSFCDFIPFFRKGIYETSKYGTG